MSMEEYNQTGSQNGGNQDFSGEGTRRRKYKKKHKTRRSVEAEDEQEINGVNALIEGKTKSEDTMIRSGKKKTIKKFLEETAISVEGSENFDVEKGKKGKKKRNKHVDEQDDGSDCSPTEVSESAIGGENDKKKQLNKETAEVKEEHTPNGPNLLESKNVKPSDKTIKRLKKKKERLLKESARADNRGICYLSRIPPHMDHVKLRHILSQYGEIQRIYLAPAGPTAQLHRKRAGNQDQEFSEGWVEFTYKSTAKRVANMLNGEQIGGKKRSQFYYDLWNIKYLSKFKWDNLTEEIAYKSAIREQKLALEISAAKRERDFYLNKVDKSHALIAIEERLKKKQKLGKDSGGDVAVAEQAPKVVRHFPQKKAVVDKAEETKSQLSKDILAGVFGAYK